MNDLGLEVGFQPAREGTCHGRLKACPTLPGVTPLRDTFTDAFSRSCQYCGLARISSMKWQAMALGALIAPSTPGTGDFRLAWRLIDAICRHNSGPRMRRKCL